MLSNEEIMNIIEERENRLDLWITNKPEKLSISELNKAVKEWKDEVAKARELDQVNKKYPQQSKENLTFVYHLMNIFSAYRGLTYVQSIYIKKLEAIISTKNQSKKQKN